MGVDRCSSAARPPAASRPGRWQLFAADRAAHPDSYVAAAPPRLPFADRQFDVVLSSHLLFSYADRLDREFHVASLRELAKVRREAPVFPLVPMGMASNPDLEAVRVELAAFGLRTSLQPVDYEFQRGGNAMLSITDSTVTSASPILP